MKKHRTIAGLHTWYLLHLPLLGIGLIAGLYAVAYRVSQTTVADEELEALTEGLDRTESRLQLAMHEGAAEAMARAAAVSAPDMIRRLETLTQSVPWIQSAGLYNASGALEAATGVYAVSTSEIEASLRTALQGQLTLSRPFPQGGEWERQQVALLLPIWDEKDRLSHVLVVCASLEGIWTAVGESPSAEGMQLALMDAGGRLLMQDGTAIHRAEFAALSEGEGEVAGGGELPPYMYVTRQIRPAARAVGPTWTLVALKPWTQVEAAISRSALLNGSASALTLVLISAIGLRFRRRVLAPLDRTAQAAAKLSQGQLEVTLPERVPAELKAISDAVNHMISELKYHRQTMSFMVESRTKKIDAAKKALEKSTAHLRASYDSAQEAVLIIDLESSEILQANRRLQELFDLGDVDLKGLELNDFYRRLREMCREPVDFAKRWRYYAHHPEAEGAEEWELARPHRMTLSVYTAPVRHEDKGTICSRLWTFRDVSAQRQRDERLRHTQKLDAMSHLAGSLAHDFNNLLTVILGNLSIAKMELSGSEDVIAHLDAAEDATNRATNLARQLLGFSDRGGRLQLRPVNVNDVVRQVRDVLKESMDPRISLECAMGEDVWSVPADAGQLRQVLINLCMNAIDALPNGGRVCVRTDHVDVGPSQHGIPPDREPGPYVRVTVEDDGIGIEPAVQDRIFEPFFTTKSKVGSQGLGLAMAYGAVTKHGGWITCESAPDEGSRFSVYLLRTEQRSEPMIVHQQGAANDPHEPCILVVDDEDGVRRIAVSVLKRSSFETLEACDGEEAIRVFRDRGAGIDAVLLDLSMPKVSGRETFMALKKMNRSVPVLLCSGYPVGLDEFESETGYRAEGVIQKPFNVAELGKTVHSLLNRSLANAVS